MSRALEMAREGLLALAERGFMIEDAPGVDEGVAALLERYAGERLEEAARAVEDMLGRPSRGVEWSRGYDDCRDDAAGAIRALATGEGQ